MAHSVAMDNPSTTVGNLPELQYIPLHAGPSSFELVTTKLISSRKLLTVFERFKILFNHTPDHQRRASKETKDNINVNMSLRELFEEGLEQEGRVLNALALPCTTSYDSDPLQFILSSHCRAFEHTSDMPADIFDTTYPVSTTSFWLVATKGTISYMHCDCHGVGTVVEVLCGRKLWYIFQHRGSSADDSMIEEYMGDWAPGFIPSPDEWEAEVVLLEPGSAFYMRPDTHHAVLTLENSIVKGHHIYATTTLAKSVTGWIHTCMLEYRIANVLHPELHELLLHIMCHFYRVMTNDDDKGFHYLEIPEMSRNGLLDIIALGNLCIFSSALLPCIEESPEQVKIAIATGNWCLSISHQEDILDLGIYNECDMFESSQASVKHMEMKDFDGKETDNEGSFNEEEQSQSGDQDEENSEDASGSEYKP
ncbi:hypothetical protein IW261DRAFT_1569190 [Armillaria novae-zelandiae]|uniref:JmjC domain-containing protein n=1 Tax=Armillaria novae-zelandiae TaxID=153914 RepID=A0AA39NYM0_9AGAR|nr:hypothetical protein IW261DRAFT_1569190 [Armillaria novae-zelandiae]